MQEEVQFMNGVNKSIKLFNSKELISLQLDSTSKGNQPKWYDKTNDLYIKGQFYYQNKYWRDDLVEKIASTLGEQLPLTDKNVTVLRQDLCEIQRSDDLIKGVYSKNFCENAERYISVARIMQLQKVEFPFTQDIEAKWFFALDIMNRLVKEDCTDYLITMSILDYLVGNEDRHLNNFGLLTDNDYYRLAPLFDFGLGLFEHDKKYLNEPFRDRLGLMECKPFSADNKETIDFIKSNYDIDKYLPDKFDLTNVELPSTMAGAYILHSARYLNREVEGIECLASVILEDI